MLFTSPREAISPQDPNLKEATNEVQKHLSVRFPVHPLLNWLEATSDLGQEGASSTALQGLNN